MEYTVYFKMLVNNNVSMFYGAKPEIFQKAKLLRNNMTRAENKLWTLLKNKSVLNLRFRRQHHMDIFIADFYCHELKLVIEVDGEIHDSKEKTEYDNGRTSELINFGIEIIRFTNEQILYDFENVKNKIINECYKRKAVISISKSPEGEYKLNNYEQNR